MHPIYEDFSITNIVGRVAGCLEGVPGVGLLGKAKVSQLQHTHVVCNSTFEYLQSSRLGTGNLITIYLGQVGSHRILSGEEIVDRDLSD